MWQTEKEVTVGGGELAIGGVGEVAVAWSEALWTWVKNVCFI